ncbi:MAG TPA: hypothetical protein VFK05_14160 [Polyangiaceae bacterium]|nr:hypothetical protein [Polyangiaceae bacterium]
MKHWMNRMSVAGWCLAVVACSVEPAAKTAAKPATSQPVAAPPSGTASAPAAAAEHVGDGESKSHDDTALLALLPSAKLDLARGIAQAETQGARAISAKFELEDGKLSLSVYTAKKGIELDAEHNVLAELSGDPTQPAWQPKEEVFADAKHLTRASYHLTLVQRSKMTLAAVIAKALAQQPGQVYSVEPAIHERSPIFHVLIATAAGGHVKVDIESGA